MVSQTFQEASRRLLKQGLEELARGDTRQASEKGWGAAAQMLKSIAERRGWDHRGHRHIRDVSARLARESGDAEIRRLYRVASDLHTNFYEDIDPPDEVAAGLDDVGLLLDKLERLA
ncbi:MAG: PaREP1 family protein [Chloroflexi bacterium]|nr:PaREP1 family protein [Chloroflexota bacterium]